MKPWKRVLLELLGPAALGALLWSGFAVAEQVRRATDSRAVMRALADLPAYWAFVAFFACIFAGVQSLIYTLVMEWCFARGLNPASWRAVLLSTALGTLSGASIVIGFSLLGNHVERSAEWWRAIGFFAATGTGVGAIIGGIIFWRTRRGEEDSARAEAKN